MNYNYSGAVYALMADVKVCNWVFDGARGHVHIEIEGQRTTIVFEHEDRWEPNEHGRGPTTWSWDGDREAPTLSPSIDHPDAHFHIEDGEVVPA